MRMRDAQSTFPTSELTAAAPSASAVNNASLAIREAAREPSVSTNY